MGRTATGVRGIRLDKGEDVVSLIVAESAGGIDTDGDDDVIDEVIDTSLGIGDEHVESTDAENDQVSYILTATQNGFGKRTPLAEYPRKGRGTKGVIGIQTSERNGKLVGAVMLGSNDEVLLISDGGTLVRTRASEISRVGRNTQGVTLIRLSKGETLQAVERLDGSLVEDADEEANEVATGDVAGDVAQDTPPNT